MTPNWLTRRRAELTGAFIVGIIVAALLGGPYEYRVRNNGFQVWRLNKWTGSAVICRQDDLYNIYCSPMPEPQRALAAKPRRWFSHEEVMAYDPADAPAAPFESDTTSMDASPVPPDRLLSDEEVFEDAKQSDGKGKKLDLSGWEEVK